MANEELAVVFWFQLFINELNDWDFYIGRKYWYIGVYKLAILTLLNIF